MTAAPDARALAERGLAAQEAGDSAGALALYDAALPTLGAVPELHRNRALCLRALGRPAEAAEAYRRAAELQTGSGGALFEWGTQLLETGAFAGAEEALARAVGREPGLVAAWQNLALARAELGDHGSARAAHDAAARLAPDDAAVRVNRALNLLLSGDGEAGWDEYEWRWRLPEPAHRAPAWAMPRWEGEPLDGKTLLLWTEQGAGTAIQFVRYAPRLAARGAEVIVACDPPLRRLLAAAPGVARTVPRDPADLLARADFHLPLVSAARLCGTRPGTVPPPAAFALPGETKPRARPAIALAWAGSPAHPDDARRSLPLRELAPLAERLGTRVDWISFQQPDRDAGGWPESLPLERRWPFADFYDTALALREVDFVVSADTAVAHLAGSLGRPLGLLLPFFPDWRWGTAGDGTPWYPAARLFRQESPGRWDAPVAALAARLAERFP